MRGDGVYDKAIANLDEETFGIRTGIYSKYSKHCFTTGLRTYKDSLRLCGHEKNVAVLSNSQNHVGMLERTLRKGTQMRIEKAFIHHYLKFGLTEEDFNDAFLRCEETLEAYK